MLLAAGVAALLVSVIALRPGTSSNVQAATGPELVVGGVTSVDATHVSFTVSSAGSGFSAYGVWNLELSWDPGVFTFDSVDLTGAQINGGNGICPAADSTTTPPPVAFPQNAGSFVNMGCVSLGSSFNTAGLLATVTLTVVAPGCSNIHLVTFGAPDNGDTSTGSYTAALGEDPDTNTYTDETADDTGTGGCAAGPASTPTPTDTPTETPTATNTVQATPPTATETPFGGLRTITPSPEPATDTPVPPAPTDTPPSGTTGGGESGGGTSPGGQPGGVSGGPGGTITLPDTGSGGGTSYSAMSLALMVAALVLAGSGAGLAWSRGTRLKK